MKKFLAVALSVMLVLGCAAALAEGTELATVEFEDFQIDMPADWEEIELTEEQTAAGVIYALTNAEKTRSITIAFAETEDSSVETISAQLTANENMSEVAVAEVNGLQVITFSIASLDQACFVLPVEGGFYTFYFLPASDAEFSPIGAAVIQSLMPVAE